MKPENLVIASDGRVKLCDFGLSVSLDARGRCVTCCGTVCMTSPEALALALSRGPGDRRGDYLGYANDLWALGCALLELSTGGLAWDDDSARAATSDTARTALLALGRRHATFFATQPKKRPQTHLDSFLDELLIADPTDREATNHADHPFLKALGGSPPFIPTKWPDVNPKGLPPWRDALGDALADSIAYQRTHDGVFLAHSDGVFNSSSG